MITLRGAFMERTELLAIERPMKRDFSRLGFGVLALMAVWYGATYALAFGLRQFVPQLLGNPIISWIVNDVALYLCGLPVMFLIVRKSEKTTIQKTDITVGSWLIILLIAIGVMMAGNMISNSIIYIYQAVTKKVVDNSLQLIISSSKLWQVFLFTVVIAPIGEEFVFRRLLCDRLRKYGDLTAILISAWMFGCFHGNLFQIIYGFTVGAVLAYVYLRYGKLRYTIYLHATLNFLGGFVSAVILKYFYPDPSLLQGASLTELMENFVSIMISGVYSMLMSGLMIAGIVLFIVYVRQIRLNKGEVSIQPHRAIPVTFGNAGNILLAVAFAAIILYDLLV